MRLQPFYAHKKGIARFGCFVRGRWVRIEVLGSFLVPSTSSRSGQSSATYVEEIKVICDFAAQFFMLGTSQQLSYIITPYYKLLLNTFTLQYRRRSPPSGRRVRAPSRANQIQVMLLVEESLWTLAHQL